MNNQSKTQEEGQAMFSSIEEQVENINHPPENKNAYALKETIELAE